MNKKELNLNDLTSAAGGTGEDARYYIHTVKKGDTLRKLSKHYGVSVEDLIQWNNIQNRNLIYIGQELRIYG